MTFLYPMAGFEAGWLMGRRGLTQLRLQGDARLGWDMESGGASAWREARASLSLERVVLAVTDQPVSLYAQASSRLVHMPTAGLRTFGEAQLNVGLRLSFLVPARPDYEGEEEGQ